MPKPQRFCIFCGGPRLSREHVWPQWLDQYVPKNMTEYFAGETTAHPTFEENKRKKWGGDPRSRSLKIVCEKCNSGWMSKLQEQAKSILLPLILGQPAVLNQNAQECLAAWIAMTVVTAEFFYPSTTAISSDQRYSLYHHQRPPTDGWKIWIGRYQRGKWQGYWAKNSQIIISEEDTSPPSDIEVPPPNTQTTTLVVGELYIHVFSCPSVWVVDRIGLTSKGAEKIAQIWPIQESMIAWPISLMSDLDADNFASAIANTLDRLGRRL